MDYVAPDDVPIEQPTYLVESQEQLEELERTATQLQESLAQLAPLLPRLWPEPGWSRSSGTIH
jgi:hypothetical protein